MTALTLHHANETVTVDSWFSNETRTQTVSLHQYFTPRQIKQLFDVSRSADERWANISRYLKNCVTLDYTLAQVVMNRAEKDDAQRLKSYYVQQMTDLLDNEGRNG